MKQIIINNSGSVNPVLIYIICLGLISFLMLLLGYLVEPFMNLINSSDSSIALGISTPRGYVSTFIQIMWPRGILLALFLILSGALIMEYQKNKYLET